MALLLLRPSSGLLLPLLSLLLLAGQTANAAAQLSPGDRQFILVFDAGSTGTRLNVFEFKADPDHSTGLRIVSLVEEKISPGLSAYANYPERLREALAPLMKFAKATVPASFQNATTAIVRATAGLRMLDDGQRAGIVRVVAEVLRKSSFVVPSLDKWAVRVISGREEAEYGWVAVNFLMDAFDQPSGDTFGMLDLGGGSTQITFVPKTDDTDDSYRVVFRTVRGQAYILHEHSYLGLGMSQAALYMFGHNHSEAPQLPVYTSPCLSPAFAREFSFGLVAINVTGDPDVSDQDRLERCYEAARVPLQKVGVHQPPGVKVAKFVAVSTFYYTAEMLRTNGFWDLPIPGNATVSDLAEAAGRVCASPPKVGRYEPYLCMNTAYIVTLLRDGYRFASNQSLFITDQIHGYSASWPLGVAIHYLTCHDQSRSNCLDASSSASAGYRATEGLFIGAATLLLLSILLRHPW